MSDNKTRPSQRVMRFAVILRLLFTAVLMLLLSLGYSDEHENLFRLYQGSRCLIIVIVGFFIDTILTILWLYRPKLHTLHLVLYIALGGIIYMVYSIDILNESGIMVDLVAFIIASFIWLIGLIPFLIYKVGIKKLIIVCLFILVVFAVWIIS